MLDVQFVKTHAEHVRAGIAAKGEEGKVDDVFRWEEERRRILDQLETLNRTRNLGAREIGRQRSAAESREWLDQVAEMRLLSQQTKALRKELEAVEARLEEALLVLPNLPDSSVPEGKDDTSNVEVKRWGTIPKRDFLPKTHREIGAQLGLWDKERASKIAGHGFVVFKGIGARLHRALIDFMLDLHIREHKYTELCPPFLVDRQSMTGTGQLPKMEFGMYRASSCKDKDFFLIPSAEVPLVNMHREEVRDACELPINYVAYTPCFRREAGTYGKATQGLVRLHQFGKVDLVKLVLPEQSDDAFHQLLIDAEAVLQHLGLPYRVMALCTGQLSFATAKGYAIEVWAAGMGRYLEVATCNHFRDFQARRAHIRFRRRKGAKSEYVHTMNASGVALPRTIIALLENYQTAEGQVVVPEILREYMAGIEVLGFSS